MKKNIAQFNYRQLILHLLKVPFVKSITKHDYLKLQFSIEIDFPQDFVPTSYNYLWTKAAFVSSGKKVFRFSKNSFLCYATSSGKFIIAAYFSFAIKIREIFFFSLPFNLTLLACALNSTPRLIETRTLCETVEIAR